MKKESVKNAASKTKKNKKTIADFYNKNKVFRVKNKKAPHEAEPLNI
ncbi:MAG: hypothetical protein H0W84_04625 [Bacteroidetes bacterium]|nr:hypothetical protein [Bacteroidota bacterium]